MREGQTTALPADPPEPTEAPPAEVLPEAPASCSRVEACPPHALARELTKMMNQRCRIAARDITGSE
jgi:hypothetical protein